MNLTAERLAEILTRHESAGYITTAVETGTFRGERAELFACVFETVHTIELSSKLFHESRPRLTDLGVICYLGDSRTYVPILASAIQAPALWYLDAHWFSLNRQKSRAGYARDAEAQIAGQAEGLPLWGELEALAEREFADVIVVDDARDFGRSEPTPEWEDISLERIAAYFPDHQEAAIMGDQAVVWR